MFDKCIGDESYITLFNETKIYWDLLFVDIYSQNLYSRSVHYYQKQKESQRIGSIITVITIIKFYYIKILHMGIDYFSCGK